MEPSDLAEVDRSGPTIAPDHKTRDRPEPSRRQLWFAAIKPPMYTVAIVPIWLGSAMAWFETGRLDLGTLVIFLLSAIAIIGWLNLSNDYFDSFTGIDVNKAHSVVNLTGNRSLVFWIANACLVAGLAGVLSITLHQGDGVVLGLILLGCALGYTYQGPPFRLGYLGLGEPICLVAFGPITVSAAYWSQTQAWSGPNLAMSLFVGITTSLILFCSHFHQVADDIAAGKRSPVVRLGLGRSVALLPWICGLAFASLALLVVLAGLPWQSLLAWLSLPWAVQLCRYVSTHLNDRDRLSRCKFIAVTLHFWSGLLLGAGLAWASVASP